MKTYLYNTEKREYITPVILVVGLDNEISLQLESAPPVPGNEGISAVPEFFDQNPFNVENCC
ncbi:MAG TPA: hypothetical protein VI413_05565 [Paludibacter sp.]